MFQIYLGDTVKKNSLGSGSALQSEFDLIRNNMHYIAVKNTKGKEKSPYLQRRLNKLQKSPRSKYHIFRPSRFTPIIPDPGSGSVRNEILSISP